MADVYCLIGAYRFFRTFKLKKFLLLSLILGLTASIYGCGIKGPLYIEDENATENTADAEFTQSTADAEDAADTADTENSADADAKDKTSADDKSEKSEDESTVKDDAAAL